ncbi:hypothetical protein [Brachybacterium kimchii]|uniref:Uncharacterized protein n=1 Tax=Brachybacterium kimchii TaxID=2942909 RepID=A0ABY4N7B9_9MICO|nr:hypothetical protein [Brachybacterium kimchii]UQN30456.1 hypothetical protein M4486_03700 [Brachybacterium kimchii]
MPETRSPHVDMYELTETRRRANAARGELLQLIADETLTPWEAVIAAATSGDKHLMRLQLAQLITAHPRFGQARASQVIEQVANILDTTPAHSPNGRITLAFILDHQAQGKRLLAVLDAFISHGLIHDGEDLAVWPGFPFTPPPLLAPKEGR